jgi:hypothetical protein
MNILFLAQKVFEQEQATKLSGISTITKIVIESITYIMQEIYILYTRIN